jgi:hypothetical protein
MGVTEMVEVKETIELMRGRGIKFRVKDDGKLSILPAGEATSEEKIFIRENYAAVLAYVTGKPIEDFMEEDVLTPVEPKAKRLSPEENLVRFERWQASQGAYHQWPSRCTRGIDPNRPGETFAGSLLEYLTEHEGSQLLIDQAFAFSIVVEHLDGSTFEFKRERWSNAQEKFGVADKKKKVLAA